MFVLSLSWSKDRFLAAKHGSQKGGGVRFAHRFQAPEEEVADVARREERPPHQEA